MAHIPYSGAYVCFRSTEKAQAGLLMSADCLVGDALNLVPSVGDASLVWVENKFGKRIGKLDDAGTELFRRSVAKDWVVHALLASVYCDSEMVATRYWGEIVLIAAAPSCSTSVDTFTHTIAGLLADGVRPEVDLGQQALEQLIAADGNWKPTGRVAALKPANAVVVKSSMSMNEKLVEAARGGNKGCLAAAWITLAACAALLVYLAIRLLGI